VAGEASVTCGPLCADRERNYRGHQRNCGETPHADIVRLFAIHE